VGHAWWVSDIGAAISALSKANGTGYCSQIGDSVFPVSIFALDELLTFLWASGFVFADGDGRPPFHMFFYKEVALFII
jgi:hypothetical protein